MNAKNKSARRRWAKIGLVALLATALLSNLMGCERSKKSKSSGLPTVLPAATTTISQVVVSASPTIVTTFETPTSGTGTPSPTAAPPTTTPTSPPAPTATSATPGTVTYTVQPGDTLYSIAQRYNVTVDEIRALNNITDPNSLRVGQVLIISRGATVPTPTTPGQETVHVVQRGENLFRIALRYGTTVQAIANRNGIVNPALIGTGQRLIIPAGGGSTPPARIHTVQRGENLYRIALRYGTTPWAIAVANGLSNIHYIYVGQQLRIP
jgi:LysM repeat protein